MKTRQHKLTPAERTVRASLSGGWIGSMYRRGDGLMPQADTCSPAGVFGHECMFAVPGIRPTA